MCAWAVLLVIEVVAYSRAIELCSVPLAPFPRRKHTLLLSSDTRGGLLSFGMNSNGALGLGHAASRSTATLVGSVFSTLSVAGVSTNYQQTLVTGAMGSWAVLSVWS